MGFKGLTPINYGGREVWPLIEGGKGVSATNHASSGAWAAAGGIGTVSAVNADSYDAEGKIVPQVYDALTRKERHLQLIQYAIDGAVDQVKRAHAMSGGKGAININVLWEMGGAQAVLEGVLERPLRADGTGVEGLVDRGRGVFHGVVVHPAHPSTGSGSRGLTTRRSSTPASSWVMRFWGRDTVGARRRPSRRPPSRPGTPSTSAGPPCPPCPPCRSWTRPTMGALARRHARAA